MGDSAREPSYFWRYPKGPMSGYTKLAWHNGEIVPFDAATVHVRSETAMRGINVFEGIRAYWNADDRELYIFRLADHLERMFYSAKIIWLRSPYNADELSAACLELIRRNELREDLHIRPMVYLDQGDFAFYTDDEAVVGATITITSRPTLLPDNPGIHCCVSSWTRLTDNAHPPRANVGANYINSRLAAIEARLNGYHSAILLNGQGEVTEGPGASLIMVRGGSVVAPAITADVLEGITQTTLLELFARELEVPVERRPIDRTELYLCDELMFVGTGGGEITPVLSVDRRPVANGEPGPLTRRIQRTYLEVITGRHPGYRHWLTPVYGDAKNRRSASS